MTLETTYNRWYQDIAMFGIVAFFALWKNIFNFYMLSPFSEQLNTIKEGLGIIAVIFFLSDILRSRKSMNMELVSEIDRKRQYGIC